LESLHRTLKRRLQAVSATAISGVILIGCAVGPNFQPPPPPTAKSYTTSPLPEKTASAPGRDGSSQRFVVGRDIPREWWTLFHSEALDRLIRQAMDNHPTLTLAQARLREAQENRRAQFGALLPSIDANVGASRQKISGAGLGQPNTDIGAFNLINASVNVTYTFDLFGGLRRQMEAAESRIEYQQFQLEAAHLTLSANIVTTAIKEASLRRQIKATNDILAVLKQQLAVVEQQLGLGGASLADVLAQRTQLAQTQASLPPLERDLTLTRHQLAVLTGKLPSEAALPEFEFETLQLPGNLPVSLPSDLVRHRPDIRAAEALLHAASAQVGVATADLYPRITLTGAYGSSAASVGDLFSGPATIWNFGAGLLQPVFRGGTLTAKRRAAIAAYDQAMAQYRDTVLQSFLNVADTLRSLEADARILQVQTDAAQLAQDTLALSRKQFEVGAVSYLTLLNAERQYGETQINLARARAARFSDTAALFQALGGGWWNNHRRDAPGSQQSKE
jgi:NodT family efflux transporter outer membrane factor (OMF) lipoprotein